MAAISVTRPEIEIENLDGVPFPARLAFSRIRSLTNPPSKGVHNDGKLTLDSMQK